jgi:hypothetical protein
MKLKIDKSAIYAMLDSAIYYLDIAKSETTFEDKSLFHHHAAMVFGITSAVFHNFDLDDSAYSVMHTINNQTSDLLDAHLPGWRNPR